MEKQRFKKRVQAGHSELIALDFGKSGIKAVKLRRVRDQIQVLGADILAPFPISADVPPDRACRLGLPPHLLTKYAALVVNTPQTKIRLLANPQAHGETDLEEQIREQMGIDAGTRMASLPISSEPNRPPDRRLAVSIPESEIQIVLALTASGSPAPCSLQAAGLATFDAFSDGIGSKLGEDAAFLIEAGSRFSFVYCIHKRKPVLLRRHDQGAEALVDHLRSNLGIDRKMASTVLCDGAVDISSAIQTVMKPLFKQLMISRDFVERQEKCVFRSLFLSGGLSRNRLWVKAVEEALRLRAEVWNPFSGFSLASGAFPERLGGDEPRFTAALGAGLGVLQSHAVHD